MEGGRWNREAFSTNRRGLNLREVRPPQEYFEHKHDLTIEETELRQVVYVLACNDATLHVKGKLNSIIVGK